MRAGLIVFAVLAAALSPPAVAAQLVLPEPKPVFSGTYSESSPPWVHEQPNFALTEKPVGEIIAIKLGFAEGRAELFRYRLDNGPSEKTTLDGVVEGGGVKLKLSW